MRTTITLEPDVEALLKRAMAERRMGFKSLVNEAIRRGLRGGESGKPYRLPTVDLGPPLVPLDKALQLATDLEDDERRRKLALRK